MSQILYYSNHCEKCKKLLQKLSKSTIQKEFHFLCIDKRVAKQNKIYLVLEGNHEVLLPPTVTKVPALLLLNRGHHVLFGDEIYQHIQPKIEQETVQAVQHNEEPMCFSLTQMGNTSDQYSYLDQGPDELSAKGDGGMRQLHNYVTINELDHIETPPDTYQADTIGDVSVDQLNQQREQALRK